MLILLLALICLCLVLALLVILLRLRRELRRIDAMIREEQMNIQRLTNNREE